MVTRSRSRAAASTAQPQAPISERIERPNIETCATTDFACLAFQFGTVWSLLSFVRMVSAMFNNITDCDETFNYWEPMHYLMFGTGFQTWEYSPVYRLRSWTYVGVHSMFGEGVHQYISDDKVVIFYLTRAALGLFCSFTEAYFYRGVVMRFGNTIALYTLIFMGFGAGMFHASTAFLPSTFCMYLVMVVYGAWFRRHYATGVVASILAVVAGWPFVAALFAPFALHVLLREGAVKTLWMGVNGIIVCALPITTLDTVVYRRFTLAALNIVLYNVVRAPATGGSALYGTEPASFYVANLLLNFNVAALLAVLLPLTMLLGVERRVDADARSALAHALAAGHVQLTHDISAMQVNREVWGGTADGDGSAAAPAATGAGLSEEAARRIRSHRQHQQQQQQGQGQGQGPVEPQHDTLSARWDCAFYAAPLYLWLLVMTAQPHKEERFLFVVYPLLCLSAAAALRRLSLAAQTKITPLLPSLGPLCAAAPMLLLLLFAALSLSRVVALSVHYGAPLALFRHLSHTELAGYRGLAPHAPGATLGLRALIGPDRFDPDSARGGRSRQSAEALAGAGAGGGSGAVGMWDDGFLEELLPDPVLDIEVTVCMGKEWYRFPASFFLPADRVEMRFLRSSFRGQLPSHFMTVNGTWREPPNMNDLNAEEPSRYVHINRCHYVVDLNVSHGGGDSGDPRYALQQDEWETVWSQPFLDAARSPSLYRAFYIPLLTPERVTVAPYVLLRRRGWVPRVAPSAAALRVATELRLQRELVEANEYLGGAGNIGRNNDTTVVVPGGGGGGGAAALSPPTAQELEERKQRQARAAAAKEKRRLAKEKRKARGEATEVKEEEGKRGEL